LESLYCDKDGLENSVFRGAQSNVLFLKLIGNSYLKDNWSCSEDKAKGIRTAERPRKETEENV